MEFKTFEDALFQWINTDFLGKLLGPTSLRLSKSEGPRLEQ